MQALSFEGKNFVYHESDLRVGNKESRNNHGAMSNAQIVVIADLAVTVAIGEIIEIKDNHCLNPLFAVNCNMDGWKYNCKHNPQISSKQIADTINIRTKV